MPKAHFAEWLLARASTPERASEIVGDLTEQKLSALSFWLTTTGILVALTWRWMLGFVLAGVCAVAVVVPYRLAVVPRWNLPLHGHGRGDIYTPWALWALYLSVAAICFGTSTGLIIARYGTRDRLLWISAAFWVTLTICACATWLPYATWAILIVLIAGPAALLLFRATRRPFLCVLAATASYGASSAVFVMLSRGTSIPHSPAGNATNVIFGVVTSLVSVGIQAVVLGRLRRVPSHTLAN